MTTQQKEYDIAVIGGGPAGLTAGLYAARAGKSAVLLEGNFPGGQQATTNLIQNYPGFPEGIGGPELSQKMLEQAQGFGLELRYDAVEALALAGDKKVVTLVGGATLTARAVILCMGATPRALGVDGEDRLRGRGVSYCATCDGAFYRGKDVAVIGGGDTAVEDALFLAGLAKSVTLIHRRDALRAVGEGVERLKTLANVKFVLETTVSSILGEQAVRGIRIMDIHTHTETELPVDGVFVAVGTQPATELVKEQLKLDPAGYILAGEDTKTSIPNVFAAGDLRQKPLRQILCAAADGAVAATAAVKALS